MMLATFLVAVWYSLHLGVSVYALCVGNSGAAPCLLGMCVCACMKTCAGMQAEIGGLGSTSNGEAALMLGPGSTNLDVGARQTYKHVQACKKMVGRQGSTSDGARQHQLLNGSD